MNTATNPKELAPTPAARVYAGFWIRFVASMIDTAILMCIFSGVGLIMRAIGMPNPITQLILITIPIAYFVILESSEDQGTIGKQVTHLRVVDENGARISIKRAIGRYFGKFISSILAIGYIMAAFTDKKQALHDKMANCYVVRA